MINYKLLANVNYSVLQRDTENGVLRVHASLENKEEFNEELIVQRHSEDEEQAEFLIPMDRESQEQFSLTFNGKELQCFRTEDQAYYQYNKMIKLNSNFESLLEVEIVDKEVFITPPPHSIRKEVLIQMGIEENDYNRDFRKQEDEVYDGYIPDGCASDGTPLF